MSINYYFQYYIRGKGGETETIIPAQTSTNEVYNIFGSGGDNIAQKKWDDAYGFTHFYYLKDHLGNIKMILNSSGNVDSYNDYYPFGMQMPGRNQTASADGRYKFTSKELDAETNLYYFGARYYDSWSGQWGQVDPMANKYPGWSPYNYTLDNPMNLIDPNGAYSYTIDGVPIDQGLGADLMQQYQQEAIFQHNKDMKQLAKQQAEQQKLVSQLQKQEKKTQEKIGVKKISNAIGWSSAAIYSLEQIANKAAHTVSSIEWLDVLRITGGTAKYIGKITPILSAGFDLYIYIKDKKGANRAQEYINFGIDGLNILYEPLGITAFVFDKTVGFRKTYERANSFYNMIDNSIYRLYMPPNSF